MRQESSGSVWEGISWGMLFFYVFYQEGRNFLLSDTNNRIDRKQGITFDCTGSPEEEWTPEKREEDAEGGAEQLTGKNGP